MGENIVCPRCGGNPEKRGGVFICRQCGFAFGNINFPPKESVVYLGTAKTATFEVTVDTETGEVLESKAFYEGEGGGNGD